jgi:uncharacterized coiled-coil DUF342 family protein
MKTEKNKDSYDIDVSKTRLAKAFERLEKAVVNKLAQNQDNNFVQEITNLQAKIAALNDENNQISLKYNELLKKYNNNKQQTQEVIEELNDSINFIEQILENNNASS